MNKIKFLAIFVFMALLTVTSCSEDNEAVNSYDENAVAKQLSFVDVDTRIANKQSKDGITIIAVIIKNIPQSPLSQSTNDPEDEANKVRPAVPIDANKAY